MARNSTPKATPKVAPKATPRTPRGSHAPNLTAGAIVGPRIEFAFGSAGRPDSATVAAVSAAFDILADIVGRAPAPRPAVAPRNAPKGVRVAYAAHNAARTAAFDLLRTAVANGRARNNGR